MGNITSYFYETPSRYYGWKPDVPDPRDTKLRSLAKHYTKLPNYVDLRENCKDIPIYDQGHLGSCTANGVAFVYQYSEVKQKTPTQFMPSRLFIYYNERDMEGQTGEDTGASIRDGIKSINKQGVCDETLWPYDISKFAVKPSEECYNQAKGHHSLKYQRVNNFNAKDIEVCLNKGYPVVFGFIVYSSFESESTAKTGVVVMPKEGEKEVGGHCVVIVGYDRTKQQFIVRNSWGENWGDHGYCYFPYEYITDTKMCSDFWIVEKISQD